jgi:hypothetical protein
MKLPLACPVGPEMTTSDPAVTVCRGERLRSMETVARGEVGPLPITVADRAGNADADVMLAMREPGGIVARGDRGDVDCDPHVGIVAEEPAVLIMGMAGTGALVSDEGRFVRPIGGTSALDSRRTGSGGGGRRREIGRMSAAVELRSRLSAWDGSGVSADVDSDVDVDVVDGDGIAAMDAEQACGSVRSG